MGFASISRRGACGPATTHEGDGGSKGGSETRATASSPLTPEMAGCQGNSLGPSGPPCVLSGSSSSSSFVDTTSSRSEGDDVDIEDGVRKDLNGLFSGMCVVEGGRGGMGVRGSSDEDVEWGRARKSGGPNDRKEPILMGQRRAILPAAGEVPQRRTSTTRWRRRAIGRWRRWI